MARSFPAPGGYRVEDAARQALGYFYSTIVLSLVKDLCAHSEAAAA
jgi:hypothetical protein